MTGTLSHTTSTGDLTHVVSTGTFQKRHRPLFWHKLRMKNVKYKRIERHGYSDLSNYVSKYLVLQFTNMGENNLQIHSQIPHESQIKTISIC